MSKRTGISAASFMWFPAAFLAALKLAGVISWPWIAVFAPLWIPLAITLAFFVIFFVAVLFAILFLLLAGLFALFLGVEPKP